MELVCCRYWGAMEAGVGAESKSRAGVGVAAVTDADSVCVFAEVHSDIHAPGPTKGVPAPSPTTPPANNCVKAHHIPEDSFPSQPQPLSVALALARTAAQLEAAVSQPRPMPRPMVVPEPVMKRGKTVVGVTQRSINRIFKSGAGAETSVPIDMSVLGGTIITVTATGIEIHMHRVDVYMVAALKLLQTSLLTTHMENIVHIPVNSNIGATDTGSDHSATGTAGVAAQAQSEAGAEFCGGVPGGSVVALIVETHPTLCP
jgi:hypothetical protein